LDYPATHSRYKPITNTALYITKGCTRFAAASNKAYQLLAHGRWFSLGTPASPTTKTGRHYIAVILLKVALSTINQINQVKIIGIAKYMLNALPYSL
jgi:hypothetical protein